MLAISYSLQMYWSTVAHERATRTHDAQRNQVQRYELTGWKSPYQSEADAVDQAHRLADGYYRQFLAETPYRANWIFLYSTMERALPE